MPKMIFVNLPVADLSRSVSLYASIGATKDERFSDATAACMTLSDTIHVMLLTHDKYRQFTTKPIADARETSAALLCLSADSREAVDAITESAGRSGARLDPSPVDDHGWMYGRSFEDPDGHMWSVMWMDLEACMAAMGKAA